MWLDDGVASASLVEDGGCVGVGSNRRQSLGIKEAKCDAPQALTLAHSLTRSLGHSHTAFEARKTACLALPCCSLMEYGDECALTVLSTHGQSDTVRDMRRGS